MSTTSIGLDIGSSAVRAAEIYADRSSPSLRRYAQVGLPAGAVVDGEVMDALAVSAALRRLWSEGGFSGNKVVLGVSGHRVIVRQAEVPALNEEDLRSALQFDAQELIPIPMEDAAFDFRILDRSPTADGDGKSTVRILLVAAHRDLLRNHLAALRGAGLEATAVDATPLALLRVVPPTPAGPGGGGGVEALVSIGAEMTTVAVREGSTPKFIRSLAVGGAKLTLGIAGAMHIEPAVAERLKRGALPEGSPQLAQARRAVSGELRDLAEEVRATVDFFVAQSDGSAVERLLVTGGASQTAGLVEALSGGLSAQLYRIDPFASLGMQSVVLAEADLQRARATAATAVGLALWPFDAVESRLTVLPDEVNATRRARRLTAVAAASVAGVAVLLGAAAVGQHLAIHRATDQVHAVQGQVTTLQGQVTQLEAATAVHRQVQSRAQLVVTSLAGDVDWVRLLGQLASVMPPNLSLATFSGTSATPSPAATASTTQPSGIGTLSFSVKGTGGLPAVSAWLDGLGRDPSLQGVWVSGISLTRNGGSVTFSSTAGLARAAASNRASKVEP